MVNVGFVVVLMKVIINEHVPQMRFETRVVGKKYGERLEKCA